MWMTADPQKSSAHTPHTLSSLIFISPNIYRPLLWQDKDSQYLLELKARQQSISIENRKYDSLKINDIHFML